MNGMTPLSFYEKCKQNIEPGWRRAFLTVLVVGLAVHLPVMVGDYPNHDGLSSMYFDQNMITSGRWFLGLACSISSYFTLPWMIGLLSLVFLGIGAAALVDFLEVKNRLMIMLIAALLVSFPALASTYAYIFTADGYMMALAFVFLAVAVTKRFKWGFLGGAVLLACSMGAYQSYLAFAVLLCMYGVLQVLLENHGTGKKAVREKITHILRYVWMGLLGVGLYYVLLQILLKIQGKELDTYQGINGMAAGSGRGIAELFAGMYRDFISFVGAGNVLYHGALSLAALLVPGFVMVCTVLWLFAKRGYWKKPFVYAAGAIFVLVLPAATNLILFIAPDVTYHLLMRYQYVLFPILCIAFFARYGESAFGEGDGVATVLQASGTGTVTGRFKGFYLILAWAIVLAGGVLCVHYCAADQIGYSNLQKKYEKTYAYCLRLADRMEQTEGYYPGIPVAMVGVQSKTTLPPTDISEDVTSNMIGLNGDYLVYTDNNYQAFMKNYLGITMNLVPDEEMERIYYTDEYQALDSFPGPNAMKVIDGVLCIKTE